MVKIKHDKMKKLYAIILIIAFVVFFMTMVDNILLLFISKVVSGSAIFFCGKKLGIYNTGK